MLEGNYTIKESSFRELIDATMDVDASGEQGQFTFVGTDPVKMIFSDPQNFAVDGPGGTWQFKVKLNMAVIGKDEIEADGDVVSPTVNPDEPGTFTSTAEAGGAAKAATEGY